MLNLQLPGDERMKSMIKFYLILLSFFSVNLWAYHLENASMASEEEQKTSVQNAIEGINSTSWQAYQIESAEGLIDIQLPNKPKFGKSSSEPLFLMATDEDGMTFKLTILSLMDRKVNIPESIDFLRKELENSSKRDLHDNIYPTEPFGLIGWTDIKNKKYHQLGFKVYSGFVLIFETCANISHSDNDDYVKEMDKTRLFIDSAIFTERSAISDTTL